MNYVVLLSGGVGARCNSTIPKQYVNISGKPVIIHTLNKYLKNECVDKIVIVCNEKYVDFIKDEIKKEYKNLDLSNKIYFTNSGASRIDSLMNGCYFIRDNFKISEDDIVMTANAVGLLVDDKIISDGFKVAKEVGCSTTVYPNFYTIAISNDGKVVDDITQRDKQYILQDPQSFNLIKLINAYENLDVDMRKTLTEGSRIFIYNNLKVGCVMGKQYNIKVTTLEDLDVVDFLNKREGN